MFEHAERLLIKPDGLFQHLLFINLFQHMLQIKAEFIGHHVSYTGVKNPLQPGARHSEPRWNLQDQIKTRELQSRLHSSSDLLIVPIMPWGSMTSPAKHYVNSSGFSVPVFLLLLPGCGPSGVIVEGKGGTCKQEISWMDGWKDVILTAGC